MTGSRPPSSAARRAFLGHAIGMGGAALVGPAAWSKVLVGSLGVDTVTDPFAGGRRLEVLRLEGARRDRLERTHGRGLDGRRSLDLATLTADTLVVPNDRFFIRTRCPDTIDFRRPWHLSVRGLVGQASRVTADALDRDSKPQGVHLLECSGNGGSFGLISTARWTGVPLTDVLRRLPVRAEATRLRVVGFDRHSDADAASMEPGASWVFSFADLERTGAFLATGMNGVALPRDHGFPVRLVVPGWYGCTCIKWVNELVLEDETAAATRHMREYAGRTHQRGTPRRARDYRAASIDLAALPIRVERWRVDGRIVHRVVGIVWGGDRTDVKLQIRFGPSDAWETVDSCDRSSHRTWGLWSHAWRPAAGDHEIRLRSADATVRSRRLDRGFYTRRIRIDVG